MIAVRRAGLLLAALLLALVALVAAGPAPAHAACYTTPETRWSTVCLPSRLRLSPEPTPPSRWGCFRVAARTGRWPHGCRTAWHHVAAARSR